MQKQGAKLNLSYGSNDTGDLTDISVIESFSKFLDGKKCSFITADGGIDKSENDLYDIEEIANAKLFFGEILTAMSIQEENGTFVLKIYDIYYELTMSIILLLQKHYEVVKSIKPKTSRPANSEKYIVASKFKGISSSELTKYYILLKEWNSIETEPLPNYTKNKKFIQKIFNCNIDEDSNFITTLKSFNERTAKMQYTKLLEGISIYDTYEDYISSGKSKGKDKNPFEKFYSKSQESQTDLAIAWCKKYAIPLKAVIKLNH